MINFVTAHRQGSYILWCTCDDIQNCANNFNQRLFACLSAVQPIGPNSISQTGDDIYLDARAYIGSRHPTLDENE
jgi:hypothetical protein